MLILELCKNSLNLICDSYFKITLLLLKFWNNWLWSKCEILFLEQIERAKTPINLLSFILVLLAIFLSAQKECTGQGNSRSVGETSFQPTNRGLNYLYSAFLLWHGYVSLKHQKEVDSIIQWLTWKDSVSIFIISQHLYI